MRNVFLTASLLLSAVLGGGCFLFAPTKSEKHETKQVNTKSEEKRSIFAKMTWKRKEQAETPPAATAAKSPAAASKPAAESKPGNGKPKNFDLKENGKSVLSGAFTDDGNLESLEVGLGTEAAKTETAQLTTTQKIINAAKESYTWIIGGCFLLIIGGVFVAININKWWGLGISASGLFGLSVAVILRDSPFVLGMGGLMFIGCAIAFAVAYWLKHKNETTATSTATTNWAVIKDLVGGVDSFKEKLTATRDFTAEQIEKVIDLLHTQLGDSQDKTSKKAVDQAQAEIKAKV